MRNQESGEPTEACGDAYRWHTGAAQHSYFTHIYDGDTYISLLGMLASSLTASSAEIKAATEKRIEPSTKSSSPIGGHRHESY